MPFDCICPDIQSVLTQAHIPYLNFRFQIGATGNVFESNNTMAWMGDGSVVTVLNIYDRITINTQNLYQIDNGYQWGDIWLKIYPSTGDYVATPLLSQNGTILTNSVNSSADGEHIYRTTVINGNGLQISPDGTEWDVGVENDSLFHAVLIKDSSVGENFWSVPLFSYENLFGSDTSIFSLTQFQVEPIEINSYLYVSMYYRLNLHNESDSLYFDDYMGDQGLYGKPQWFEPSEALPGFVAKSAREIIKFNENGERVGKLTYPIRNPDQWSFYNAGWFFQEPELFEINGKLGWPLAYTSMSDTTLYFLRQMSGQTIDSTGIDLPAGRGTFVLWIDEELEILNYTNFTYSTPSSMSQGVSIQNIKAINQDTLAIFGKIGNNTTTTLDPQGIAEEITYSPGTSFFALYSLPDFLVSIKEDRRNNGNLVLYPNPTHSVLNFRGEYPQNSEFLIYDLSGRLQKRGFLDVGQSLHQLDISFMTAGLYFFKIQNGLKVVASGKFAVN